MGNACSGPSAADGVKDPTSLKELEDEVKKDIMGGGSIRLTRPTNHHDLDKYKKEVAEAKRQLSLMKSGLDPKIVQSVTSEAYRVEFKKAFERYDVNKNGNLEPKELGELVLYLVNESPLVKKFFRSRFIMKDFIVYFDAMDDPSSGHLSYDEAYDLLTVLASLSLDHFMKEAIKLRAALDKTLASMSYEASNLVRKKAFDDAVHIAFSVATGANGEFLEQEKLGVFLRHFCQELETCGASFNIPTEEAANLAFAVYDVDFSGNLSHLEAQKMCVVLAAQFLNGSITRQLSRKSEGTPLNTTGRMSASSNGSRHSQAGSAAGKGVHFRASDAGSDRGSVSSSTQEGSVGPAVITRTEHKQLAKNPNMARALSMKFDADWKNEGGARKSVHEIAKRQEAVRPVSVDKSAQGPVAAAAVLPRKSLPAPEKGTGKFDRDW